MKHDWDPFTQYCLLCGCSLLQAIDQGRKCSPENVIPISHVLSAKRFERAAPGIAKLLKDTTIP